MKKTLSVLLVFMILLPLSVLGENENTSIPIFPSKSDLTQFSDNQLLQLYEDVATTLRNRGKFPYVVLKSGATGDEVANMQRRLAELGYYTKDPTAKFDAATTAALKAFEKASGLKSDGVAAVADQEALYSAKAISKPTPTPKPTKKPTPTPKPTKKPTPKPTKKPTPTPDPRKAYDKFDFNTAARYPSEYRGTKVKIVGKVLQVLGDRSSGFDLRVATKGRYDNVVYIITKGGHSANILEDDKITFYCNMMGDYTYESTMGQSITLPLAEAVMYNYN